MFLRQSTAVDIAIGPFLDATDGVTAETALTISQADVRLKKNNGAWAQVNDNTSATHEENGWYEKELDATDTNTCGILVIAVHESGALPVWHRFYVLEEAIFDALFTASSNAFTGAAGSTTLTALATGSITSAVIADNAIDNAALAADTNLKPDRTATAQAGGATTITLDASASAVDDFYNGSGIRIVSGTGSGQFRIISDYNGTTKVVTVAEAWLTNPDNTSVFAITPAMETAADIADAVWDEALAGHATAGTAGKALSDAGSGANAGTIADAVWDEARGGHVTVGSFGEGIGIVSMGANVLTAAAIAADAITAAKIATGAIDADALAADAGTEIAAAVLAAATATPIDANVEKINTVAITGNGSGTPFGV